MPTAKRLVCVARSGHSITVHYASKRYRPSRADRGLCEVRFEPNNGPRSDLAPCQKSASMRHRKWTRPSTKGRLIRLYAKLRAEICVSALSPHAFGHRPDRRRNVSAIRISPPKERAAHRACVNETAPGEGVEGPRAAVEIERQFNGAAPRSYIHVSHASDAQANLNHTHGVTNNVHLA
jgi:hypothetical protein